MSGKTEMAMAETVKGSGLTVLPSTARRKNQFARNNPKLQAMLDKYALEDAEGAGVDLGQIMTMCVNVIIANTEADEMGKPGFVKLMSEMETHRAKVAKLKADTESVLTNVATPSAIRAMLNEFGLCIKRGIEQTADAYIKTAPRQSDADFVRSIMSQAYTDVMAEIARMGQADSSLGRIMAAMK